MRWVKACVTIVFLVSCKSTVIPASDVQGTSLSHPVQICGVGSGVIEADEVCENFADTNPNFDVCPLAMERFNSALDDPLLGQACVAERHFGKGCEIRRCRCALLSLGSDYIKADSRAYKDLCINTSSGRDVSTAAAVDVCRRAVNENHQVAKAHCTCLLSEILVNGDDGQRVRKAKCPQVEEYWPICWRVKEKKSRADNIDFVGKFTPSIARNDAIYPWYVAAAKGPKAFGELIDACLCLAPQSSDEDKNCEETRSSLPSVSYDICYPGRPETIEETDEKVAELTGKKLEKSSVEEVRLLHRALKDDKSYQEYEDRCKCAAAGHGWDLDRSKCLE